MANEWNNFFNELFDAGANVYQGVQIGGMKKDAERTYKTAMKNIDSIIKLSPTGQQNQEETMKEEATLNSFFDGFNPGSNLSENINNMQSATLTDVPVIPERKINTPGMNTEEDLLKVFLDATAKLGGLGEYGEPYIKPLGTYYESKVPKGPVTKTDVTNGFVIKYDSDGNILKKTKIDDLPKQEKNTVMKYSKMTLEEAEQLTDNELSGDAFFYLPKETQTALMQKYPALQQLHDAKFKEGDFAPKLKKGGRIGSFKAPVTFQQESDKGNFTALSNYNDRIRSGEELVDEDLDKYNNLRLSLGDRYGLNDTQLQKVINKLNNATTENERTKILGTLQGGEYFPQDVETSQEQMEYDANRILEWQAALNDAYNRNDGSYDGYKQAFLKELDDFFNRGSITNKEYKTLKQMYF